MLTQNLKFGNCNAEQTGGVSYLKPELLNRLYVHLAKLPFAAL